MLSLLFHRFPQLLAADPTVVSVPEGGRQRNPLSISSYRLQAENRGGRRRATGADLSEKAARCGTWRRPGGGVVREEGPAARAAM
ncbi:hypothetical protein B296_00013458 [Ensete ventricosum]|uniref:Uncharacterized protein n=1 Tax=Ensete ventricosum TaxID=4639 RepID=A0A426ZY93_ENSVE|nr:hypothetical protein B296_00013458 [Ensete ventricosum]